jgi:hypothetical protein
MAETLAAGSGDREIEWQIQHHVSVACWPRGTTPARARSGLEPPYYRIASTDQFRLHFGLPRLHTNVRDKSWDWCEARLQVGLLTWLKPLHYLHTDANIRHRRVTPQPTPKRFNGSLAHVCNDAVERVPAVLLSRRGRPTTKGARARIGRVRFGTLPRQQHEPPEPPRAARDSESFSQARIPEI